MHSNIKFAEVNGADITSNTVATGDTMKRLAAIFFAAAIFAPLAYVALATAASMVS
ncbi:MAG: hypothetical protein JNJ73_13975 [Hyphomonadaceae bacterium]|nr:hypothetical protein [Hyphomonadaceae bacterium]